MKTDETVFSNLISPISEEEFFTSFYEKKHYFSEKCTLRVNFDLERFEQLLWAHGNDRADMIQLNKSGRTEYYKRKAVGKDVFRWATDNFEKGYTIIFNGIDEIDQDAARIARSIDGVFKGRTTINAFLTPKGAKGFLPHFDTHDVFVYQISGKKKWHLYKQQVELPLDSQLFLIDQDKLGKPEETIHLQAGNLLYVPRGMVHGASANDEYSLHITIGVRPILRIEYLKTMLDALSIEKPEFRKSHLQSDNSDYVQLINELIKGISHPYFIKKSLTNSDINRVSRSKDLPGEQLKNIASGKELTIDSRLVKSLPASGVIEIGEDKLKFYFAGIGLSGDSDMIHGHMAFDIIAYGALNFINKTKKPFFVRDLPEVYPDKSKIIIAEILFRKGFLRFADED